ncbi:sigma-54-dependent Fis family transcriptional regulator [Phocaeicola dorei]|uniref:Sigma-54-dependent Fis family transcriptional regulator n=1 Tax=Phocaeicola dorei TaxID=357276 RepID=A0A4R4GGE6_9BACT|nr:sigma-54 dependent transcriptional regulator [Phocaeicola dorei]TDA75127.1 sigma-54-dependent Fis family transcriptional regulator [Phocaeicola dorei]
MDKMKIIVVEDNPVYNTFICKLLANNGFKTEQIYHLSSARKVLINADNDDIILADLRLPDGESIELLKWMRVNDKRQAFIIMTDYAEVHTAVESMKLGSIDYIPKQLVEDKLVPLLHSIIKEREQKRQRQVPIFIRQGEAYRNIKKRVHLVAPTRMSVLILGENGTGKEHIAQDIHTQSCFSDKPFVAVDCGSLAPTLAPSAFFGHVKGAFTGADCNRTGYFQEAEGGTLFLDEVGNLTIEMQQMLLRAIQERRYRPVGAKGDKTANVRIVAATNENLHNAVKEKRFRQDLLHRLQEYVITIPPLRDCQEDIMPLADFFREIANDELGRNVRGFDASARKALLTHTWSGNVRELKQKIFTAVLHTESDTITDTDLELSYESASSSTVSFALRTAEEEKERIIRALKQANGNKILAARLLAISRSTLYAKIEEYGIKVEKTFK